MDQFASVSFGPVLEFAHFSQCVSGLSDKGAVVVDSALIVL